MSSKSTPSVRRTPSDPLPSPRRRRSGRRSRPARQSQDADRRAKAAQLVNEAPAEPALNLPAYDWWSEGLHGIARNGPSTVFPQAMGMAATWDTALIQKVGDVVATEARAKFNTQPLNADRGLYQGLTIWSPTSTSSAIRAGAGARKPMARTPSSPAASASPSCAGCRVPT
ncbi:glycoside hydrolase family 3 N-terminal domain-containing protein [Sphingomonas sp. I4]